MTKRTVGFMEPMPYARSLTCTSCGGTLIPLTHPPAATQRDTWDVEEEADVKCSKCGQRSRWLGTDG